MAKKVKVGMYYTAYGITTATVPDDIKNEDIPEYLKNHIDDIPLPQNTTYVDDSADIDPESTVIINHE